MAEVISFGSKLKGKERTIWRKIERDAFKDDPNFLPRLFEPFFAPEKKSEKEEFFVLSINGDYIGRARATVDKDLIDEGEEVGFIDDFVILERYRDEARLLIDRSLSSLKERGIKKVIVRGSRMFPMLEIEGYEEIAPFGLPHNPPYLADIFLEDGFLKADEYTFFHIKLPEISEIESGAKRFEETFERLKIKLRPLKRRDPLELAEFQRLYYESNLSSYPSYLPQAPPSEKISRASALFSHLILSRLRVKAFVGIDRDGNGEMVFFGGYMPDFNQVLISSPLIRRKPLSGSPLISRIPKVIYRIFKLPYDIHKVISAIPKVKSCREIGIGWKVREAPTEPSSYLSRYSKVCQEFGIGSEDMEDELNMEDLFAYFCYSMKKDGYEEITAGALTPESVHIEDVSQNFIGKYAGADSGAISTFRYASFVLHV